jgi:hypothetical protein
MVATSSIILDLLLEGTLLGSIFLLLGQLVYFYFFKVIFI